MKQKKSSKIFLVILIGCCSLISAAQSNICDLKIKTQLFEGGVPDKEIKATAENLEGKRIYKSVNKDGMPYFKSLPEGKYKFTVTGKGYKQSVLTTSHQCGLTENNDIEEKLFFVWKGDSNETVNLPLPKLGIAVDSDAPPKSRGFAVAASEPIIATGTLDKKGYLSKGVLNGVAKNLVKPEYPKSARYVKASGAVVVQVLIDEKGNVTTAEAVSGHPLLRSASVKAALDSKFSQTILEGKPVKVQGVIVYNFVP